MVERVEDTRTLKPGDLVRVERTGVVIRADNNGFTVDHGPGQGLSGWLHDGDDRAADVKFFRLPKPLPAEPPVGAEVLDVGGGVWVRVACTEPTECPPHCPGSWWTLRGTTQTRAWRDLLYSDGPLQLLGDPIEAPR